MNLERLKQAEANFLQQYPGGFDHPDLVAIGKKHRVGKMSEFTAGVLDETKFSITSQLIEDLGKVVSRSSMVSMFEKPKFRDYLRSLSPDEKQHFADAFKQLLYGDQESGFGAVVELLGRQKIAKWSLVTIALVYLRPTQEVFVKPTTAKGIIQQFELHHLVYTPKPYWEFYARFRDAINSMKKKVDPALSPNNAAFSGFLMMSRQVS